MQLFNDRINSNNSLLNLYQAKVTIIGANLKQGVFSLIVCIVFLIQGCANMSEFAVSTPPVNVMPANSLSVAVANNSSANKLPEHYWWHAKFNIPWPDANPPSWNVDLLIAHRVINPILNDFRSEIGLWRFHRRASRDSAGHQFSFMFYAKPDTAHNIYQAIDNNKLVSQLALAGALTKVLFDDVHLQRIENISDGSDKSWDIAIQQTWPYFIMGVSESWLRLVDAVVNASNDASQQGTTQDQLAFYAKVNIRVETLWQNQGGHAYIHHLNGLFGYGETYITERRLIRF